LGLTVFFSPDGEKGNAGQDMFSITCNGFVPCSLSVLWGMAVLPGVAKGKKPRNLERKCCCKIEVKVMSSKWRRSTAGPCLEASRKEIPKPGSLS
jgi:hypothetical protein